MSIGTVPTNAKDLLLEPSFMARLDQLDIMSRKLLAGKLKGERRSKRRGQSVEFADYRDYVVGDDLRFIDWNIYARLDRLFLKLFLEEEDLSLFILADVSKSCDYGTPNKAMYIKKVAAALVGIRLAGAFIPTGRGQAAVWERNAESLFDRRICLCTLGLDWSAHLKSGDGHTPTHAVADPKPKGDRRRQRTRFCSRRRTRSDGHRTRASSVDER